MAGGKPIDLPRFFQDSNVGFPLRPSLVENLSVRQIPRGLGVDFQGGPVGFILRGRFAASAFAFLEENLDGESQLDEVLDKVATDLPIQVVLDTLKILHQKGVLRDGRQIPRSARPPEKFSCSSNARELEHAFWSRKLTMTQNAQSTGEIEERLNNTRVTILASGLFGYNTIELLGRTGVNKVSIHALDAIVANQCQAIGIKSINLVDPSTTIDTFTANLDATVRSSDLLITVIRNATPKLIESINQVSLDTRTPLLFAEENGDRTVVGPFVDPCRSACLVCTRLRRSVVSDRALEDFMFAMEDDSTWWPPEKPSGESIPAAALAASQVASEATRYITKIAPLTLINHEMRINSLTSEISKTPVLRVPRCPACYRGSISDGMSIGHE